MKEVALSTAKAEISKPIAYVRRGGHVRIFARNGPVADLVPVERAQPPADDAAVLADMERRGVVTRGKEGPIPAEIFKPGPASLTVLEALLEERREGR